MKKSRLSIVALIMMTGTLFTCLPSCPCGMPNCCAIFTGLVTSAVGEFLWDNDAVFDLFQDDFGTGTQYDDRFVGEPTRAEPEGFNVNNLGAGEV